MQEEIEKINNKTRVQNEQPTFEHFSVLFLFD